ncbi:MAG: C25 family cysteine peptidase [Kiritimatiellia bacterium]
MRNRKRILIAGGAGAMLGLFVAGGFLPLRAWGTGTQYLIVTTEALAPGFADLADFRSSPAGGALTVRVATVEEIHATRSETTPEARIRGAIAAEYASGDLRWVVLGARADAIAPVMVWTPVEGIANNWTKSRGTPSDWYYACLDGDWTATETGLYGYSDFAGLDLVPEVAVGRIPAATAEGVRDYVRRLRRCTSRASSHALRADHVLLHGLQLGPSAPTDTGKMTTLSDGYPWIGEAGHPDGTTDSELWLRNIHLSRILANRPAATLDLCFPNACGDPTTRSSFTSELSTDRPADLYRYLAERPEFVAMSSHGLPAGVGRLSPGSALVPGCAWGVLYSVGCNTAQFDALSLADNGSATGMAPPEEGAFAGVWQACSLAEHLVPGVGESGGLVYIASTREGFRVDGAGGIGAYSYALLADFAERWARGGATLGELFADHKSEFRERALAAMDWRSLFVGLTYFGDPAIRPLREADGAGRAIRFATPQGEETVEVAPGLTFDEAAPCVAVAGERLIGWRDGAGRLHAGGDLIGWGEEASSYTAVFRAATAEETAPPPTADPALGRLAFDDGGAQVAVRGQAFAPTSQTTPARLDLAASADVRMIGCHLRFEAGFENDEDRGVVLALETAEHRLEFRRRFDLGLTLALDGEACGAFRLPLSVYQALAVRLSADGVEVALAGRTVATVAVPWTAATTVWFGGASAAGGYGWLAAGTLYLDEAVAFAAPDGLSAAAASRLVAAHPGAVLLWRTMPATGVCATACAFPEPAVLVLDGAGRLVPASGTILPTVEAKPFPALELPADGFVWTTWSNLDADGLGSLVWDASPASPPREELVPAAATALSVTSILPQADGSAVLTARLSSAIGVAFGGSAAFSVADPRTGATARPAETVLAGAEARIVLPPDPATVRLFRLRLE